MGFSVRLSHLTRWWRGRWVTRSHWKDHPDAARVLSMLGSALEIGRLYDMLGGRRLMDLCLNALGDPDEDIRYRALDSLIIEAAALRQARFSPYTNKAELHDFLKAGSFRSTKKYVDALLTSLKDQNRHVRLRAAGALADFGDHPGIAQAVVATGDEEVAGQYHSELKRKRALAGLGL
jgi:HEAT repeat protein